MRHCLRLRLPAFMALALTALPGAVNLAVMAESVPIAYWKFDEASGASATDSTGNGHTVTIVGAVRAPGKTGGTLSFDGAKDYVFASDAQSGGTTGVGLDIGTRDWTVAAWINTTTSG